MANNALGNIKDSPHRRALRKQIESKLPLPNASKIYDIGLYALLKYSQRMVDLDDDLQAVSEVLNELN